MFGFKTNPNSKNKSNNCFFLVDIISVKIKEDNHLFLYFHLMIGENEIAKHIVNAAYNVHVALGPGLLESSYQACLIYELKGMGLKVMSQVNLPLTYKGVYLECGYRIDILVEDSVIVELKCVSELHAIHIAQTITYLKLSKCKLGLLINFNETKIKNGIKRLVNGYLAE